MSISGKRLIQRLVHYSKINWLLAKIKPDPIVLGFHRVIESDKGLLNARIEHMSPEMLERIIQYLNCLGYQFVPLSEIVSAKGAKTVAITFDDGFQDLYQNAYPILKQYAIPFAVFLTTSTVASQTLLWHHKLYAALEKLSPEQQALTLCKYGLIDDKDQSLFDLLDSLIHAEEPAFLEQLVLKVTEKAGLTPQEEREQAENLYLKEYQIREMARHGLEVHAHGHQHWSLPTLNRPQTEIEVEKCLGRIEDLIGTKPSYYAPAFGKSNPYLPGIAREKNIKALIGTDPGLVLSGGSCFEVPRIMTTSTLGLSVNLTKAYLSNLIH